MPDQKTNSRPSLLLLIELVALAWIVECVDIFFFAGSLDAFGIQPRKLTGLIGIPFMPLLHGNFAHLISNTLPFLVLGYIMVRAEGRRFIGSTVTLIFLSGLGTWLIGKPGTVHIGASALIYGYFGYILTRAWIDRNMLWMITGIAVFIFYGGMLYGVLPISVGDTPISWQGHLCGLISGIILGNRHRYLRPQQ